MTTLEVKVPLVWKRLIEIEFPHPECNGSGDKMDDHALDDPIPYTDDDRAIRVVGEGYEFILGLASGQNNYYGYYKLIVQREFQEVLKDDVLDIFPNEFNFPNLDFKVIINWKD